MYACVHKRGGVYVNVCTRESPYAPPRVGEEGCYRACVHVRVHKRVASAVLRR